MKRTVMAVVTLLTVGLLYPVVAAVPASAADPTNVGVTLEGCRLGTFDKTTLLCDDADYTTGNLQPGWNEFDLVPHRLTLDAKNSAPATQTYTIGIAFDYSSGGVKGYDRITEPVLNTDLSTGTCTFSFTGEQFKSPGVGGIDTTIYRLITVTQAKNTTCVFDYAGRLALGASQYPGSSLHANATDANVNTAGIGARDVSIPVKNALLPQELNKDLSAIQNASVTWNVTKSPEPASLDFGNPCSDTFVSTLPVDVTVNWTKGAAVPDGQVSVTTNVYATNPSHRDILIDVSDTVSSGGVSLYTVTADDVEVLANTTQLVLTDTRNVDATDIVGGALHNVATAAYFDEEFGDVLPGQDNAEADATVQTGTTTNATARVRDSESITGAGLTFSVAAPSVGAFAGGYVAGTDTVGPVQWASGVVSDSGSVTFEKTVTYDPTAGDTTGTLSDTAGLLGSGGQTTYATLDIGITGTASGSVTVNKTTSVPVDADTTFTFEINPGGIPLTVDVAAGESSGTGSVSDLALGDYTITETDAGGFTPAPDQDFTISLGNCDVQLDVDNTFGPATAQVTKVTDPAGNEAGWEFTLYLDDTDPVGPNDPNTDTVYSTVTTDASGIADFPDALVDEGDYYILETGGPNGFISDGGVGTECAFTVDYPADADRLFSDCTFTNTAKATADVVKVTDPAGNEEGWNFSLYLDDTPPAGPNDPNTDTLIDTATTDATGQASFDGTLDAGDYYIVEEGKTGWESDGGVNCVFTVQYPRDAGSAFTCTFTNTAKGSIGITKTGGTAGQVFTFELRKDVVAPTNGGTLLDTESVTSGGAEVKFKIGGSTDLPLGDYTVCEIIPAAGWSSDLGGANQYNLTLADNEIRVCTDVSITVADQDLSIHVANTPPPGGERGTLGFWKTHSCEAPGKQTDQVTKNLPLPLGSYTVTDCHVAVRILSKQNTAKQNKASDPLFNMAAQLLAAELNVKAGASTCPTATSVISQANALLAKYNWTPVGNGYTGKLSAADKTLAGTLATQLDAYNNGGLC